MDQQNIIFVGGIAFAVAVSAYIIWGPTPHPRKKKGHIVGLTNLGSTCFLNTLLQALASCAVFVEWLNQQKEKDDSLTSALHAILGVLNGEGSGDVHTPVEVMRALRRHGWMVPAGEQDAHELFHVIISTIQEENKNLSKAGSISDALPTSDTLSQASDILEDGSEHLEAIGTEDVFILDDGSEKGGGDVSIAGVRDSPETIMSYVDALEKLTLGDSETQSTLGASEFYSLEPDSESIYLPSGTSSQRENGGSMCLDEQTLRVSPDQSFTIPKYNLNKTYKYKTSQESLRERAGGSGCYDRVTGGLAYMMQPRQVLPFQGLLTSTLQCSTCGYQSSVQCDTFDSLSLPLGDAFLCQIQTLQDLLRKFIKTEIIPEVDCDKCCKKTTAYKTMNFGKLPPCLCLHISRSTWQTASSSPTKREDYVHFPEFLPMDEYTVSARLTETVSARSLQAVSTENLLLKSKTYKHMYRLKSVVVHVGSVSSGHFVTYRRGALNATRRHRVGKLAGASVDSERWYLTSDENVRLSNVCKAMDSLAYMLFYEKCSTDAVTLSGSMASDLNK